MNTKSSASLLGLVAPKREGFDEPTARPTPPPNSNEDFSGLMARALQRRQTKPAASERNNFNSPSHSSTPPKLRAASSRNPANRSDDSPASDNVRECQQRDQEKPYANDVDPSNQAAVATSQPAPPANSAATPAAAADPDQATETLVQPDGTPAQPVLPDLSLVEQTTATAAADINNAAGLKATGIVDDPATKALLQSIEAQQLTDSSKTPGPAPPLAGITSALDVQRMKSAGQKNEIAGRTAQKLPLLGEIVPGSTDLAENTGARPAPAFATAKNDSSNLLINADSLSKFNVIDNQSGQAFDPVKDLNAASSVDRVARLVSQEVVTMKQSGANSVAVSLKVDAQTELFLQLTNHGGQLQATLRCERGDLAGLDSHWGKLQESLARQNVQLLPMQEKAGSQHSTYNPSTGHGASRQFNEQSQNPRSPMRELRGESTLTDEALKSGRAPRAVTTKTSGPQGWESWA